MDDLQSSEEATFVVEEVSQIIKEVSSLNVIGSLRCVVGTIVATWSHCSHDVDIVLVTQFQHFKFCVMLPSCSPWRMFWVAATTSTIASTSGPPQWWSSVSTNSLNWANRTSTLVRQQVENME